MSVKRLVQRATASAHKSTLHPTRAPGISVAYHPKNAAAFLRDTQTRHLSRLEFRYPRKERANLLPPLVMLGTAGLLGYYLYGLYAKTRMWPPDVRSDLRAAIKARRVGDVDTAGIYYKSALDKCLAYDDIQAALGVKHRLMLAGIAIALGGAYEGAAEAARDNHSSTIPSSSTLASAPPYQTPISSLRNRDLFKRAYDAYEIAFVVLAEGELEEHVWEHLLRAKNRSTLHRLSTRLATTSSTRQSGLPATPDSVQRETYYRLIQVSSHLSYLAGILSRPDDAEMELEAFAGPAKREASGRSYDELEALHALFALASLQQGRPARHGHTLGVPRAESRSEGRFPTGSVPTTAESNDASMPSAFVQGEGLSPVDLMRPLDAQRPYKLDYPYLLERAADVFARQGAIRQALHLYRSAADALVPSLTGEPEAWATLNMGKGTLPPRETCQVAILVNNMANVCAGTSSTAPAPPLHGRRKTTGMDPASRSADAITAARASQPQPDVHRAKGLALAAARLVEIVSESNESRMSRLGVGNNNATSGPRRNVVSECELARLVVAFNIGMLSEMLGEKVPASEAYGRTRALAKVTLKENGDELGAAAREAEKEASGALDRLAVTEGLE